MFNSLNPLSPPFCPSRREVRGEKKRNLIAYSMANSLHPTRERKRKNESLASSYHLPFAKPQIGMREPHFCTCLRLRGDCVNIASAAVSSRWRRVVVSKLKLARHDEALTCHAPEFDIENQGARPTLLSSPHHFLVGGWVAMSRREGVRN